MNARLESSRRVDIQSCLAKHTARWCAGVELDVLHEAQVQTVDGQRWLPLPNGNTRRFSSGAWNRVAGKLEVPISETKRAGGELQEIHPKVGSEPRVCQSCAERA